MNFSEDKLLNISPPHRFMDMCKIEDISGKKYLYSKQDLILCQIYRVCYLTAKNLGIRTAEYDYKRVNESFVLFTEDICEENEEKFQAADFYEDKFEGCEGDYYKYINFFTSVLNNIKTKDKTRELEEIYKQFFLAYLIGDMDRQIWLVKDKNGLYRVGKCFDFGGVCFIQNKDLEISINEFYDEQSKEKLLKDLTNNCGYSDYSVSDLQNDFEMLFQKEICNKNKYQLCNGFEKALPLIISKLDKDWIEKALSLNVGEIINNDADHFYSVNSIKVISEIINQSMCELKNGIEKLNLANRLENKEKITNECNRS